MASGRIGDKAKHKELVGGAGTAAAATRRGEWGCCRAESAERRRRPWKREQKEGSWGETPSADLALGGGVDGQTLERNREREEQLETDRGPPATHLAGESKLRANQPLYPAGTNCPREDNQKDNQKASSAFPTPE
ncbi:hypothetical protein BRADI_4g05285v3 [Brachypodium distachyon]|uniref:Uncharacterized protein n=1 Tax=Brachypodium distachyon TaxID=15368 RepID=A0A2K2CKL2_BRADI|nr:hypothetical protein BRADI_4g05285v3 [Brachypodium distachyon]PNT62571.1 hypothetical protein BRADI_4g05285v3 [Brachypodium distachyon]